MRRKLIRQGRSGLTIYLPKKWIDEHHLENGQEVEIDNFQDKLIIGAQADSSPGESIALSFPGGRESALRTILVNAYRLGYDKIELTYKGDITTLRKLVADYLIGFEVFEESQGSFSLENVAGPKHDDFEKFFRKIFFILKECLSTTEVQSVHELVARIQRYDNFLKRLISKHQLSIPSPFTFWQLLSNLTQIGRQQYHFLRLQKGDLSADEERLKADCKNMLDVLYKAYLKNDLSLLLELHTLEEQVVYNKGHALLVDSSSLHVHYLISIARLIYLASSPMAAVIEAKNTEEL